MIRALILALVFSGVAYGQQAMLLRGDAAAPLAILDGTPAADAAYCTCWLYSAYSGSLIRVRRTSDNAEQDIGRDGQGLDEAALASFCSGANCHITTWYDQSGSARDATQSNTARQPLIYLSATGVLTSSNGLPGISFSTANYRLQSIFSFSQPATLFVGADIESTDATYIFSDGYTSAFYLGRTASTPYRQHAGVNADFSTAFTGLQAHYALYNSTSSEVGVNGAAAISTNPGTGTSDGLTIGNIRGTPNPILSGYELAGKLQYLVLYESNRSANRAAIETALNNYFSIY